MGFFDWNHYGAADTEESNALTSASFEGDHALQADFNGEGWHVWAQSETDSPIEGQLVSQIDPRGGLSNNNEVVFEACFRFQDIDNYYAVMFYSDDNENLTMELASKVNGSKSRNDTSGVGSYGLHNEYNLHRITFWRDTGNDDVRARVEEDSDGDGTWTTIADMVITTPELTGGGGVGIGRAGHDFHADSSVNLFGHDARWDATEVRY